MNENYLAVLAPGVFVAVYISNYKERPVIGKLLEAKLQHALAATHGKNEIWTPSME